MGGMKRRTFLETLAGSLAAAPLAAGSPVPVRLGYDTYSIRDFGWKALQHIEYAAGLKLDSIQLSSLGDFESLEPAYLQKVKDAAERNRIVLDGGIGCICPKSKSWSEKNGDPGQYLLTGLKVSKAIGSHAVRCFMGSSTDRRGAEPIEALMEETIRVFRSVRAQALDLGVKIALENHSGDLQAWEVETILKESGTDAAGACLDTGNPLWCVEDPMVTLEILGPYAVTTHVRDAVVYEHPRGAAAQWVALGDGSLDFRKFMGRYVEICPKAVMQLEIITGRAPQVLPYLEPDFWKAFPKARASEFARFVALAKAGHPFMGSMMIAGWNPDPEFRGALKYQQRRDLERSLEYAQKVLRVGVNKDAK